MLTIPRKQHGEACAVAGINDVALHGLRRSFKSLTEWLEIPACVVAQAKRNGRKALNRATA